MDKIAGTLYPLLLLLLFAAIFFTSLHSPVVIDYDEGVYAEVSRSMYVGREAIIPTLNGSGFFAKPPLLYWSQMLGYRMFGINSMGARFFNATAAVAALLVFYFATSRALGNRVAFNGSLILGSSIIFIYTARVAMTDMLFCLFLVSCTVSIWFAVERYLVDKTGTVLFLLGSLCAALATLSKGTIGLIVPTLTAFFYLLSIGRPAVLFDRRWFVPGIAVLLLGGFSWYLLLGFVHPDGFNFVKELFSKHHVGLFSTAGTGPSRSLLYYVVILFVGFMPWFGYLPQALLRMPLKTANSPGHRFIRLFALLSVIVFVLFSITATELPSSILAALPGFALLIAWTFENRKEAEQTGRRAITWRIAGWTGVIPTVLIGIVFLALPLIFPYLAELVGEAAYQTPALFEPVALGYTPSITAVLFFVSAGILVRAVKSNASGLFETLVVCSLINACTVFFLVMPMHDRLLNAPLANLAEEAARLTPSDGTIVMYEIEDRPSVNFVSGLHTVTLDENGLSELSARFDQPGTKVGLTTSFYFERLQNRGIAAIEINRDTGFVLFRLPPANSAGGSTSDP